MSIDTATIDECATKIISAEEAWRYGPEERNMMIKAGYTIENFPASSNEIFIANPEWHTANPEELRQQGISFMAWAYLHQLMNSNTSQQQSFDPTADEIRGALEYLEIKAKTAPNPRYAIEQVARVRDALRGVLQSGGVAA